MRILFIESDRLLAQNVTRALKQAGHSTKCLVDPQAAIAAADAHCPDLIILDLLLAVHSGTEFLYEFRSYPEWIDVPIILFSSLPAAEARIYLDSLDKLNIKNFFYKPETSLAQLVEAIAQLVPKSEKV